MYSTSKVLISVKLIAGDFSVKDVFSCTNTGGKWKMVARGLPGSIKDVRIFGFEHVGGDDHIEEGFTLVAEE